MHLREKKRNGSGGMDRETGQGVVFDLLSPDKPVTVTAQVAHCSEAADATRQPTTDLKGSLSGALFGLDAKSLGCLLKQASQIAAPGRNIFPFGKDSLTRCLQRCARGRYS